ncbi:MAG: hypothetical protein IT382_20820 [Deltaproteobacteria bacterium]|nr:hypothetical protein [Deltaproteobacteria bacterium]
MTDAADLFRSLVADALMARTCARTGRVRFTLVGLDDRRFVAEFGAKGSRVLDDDGAPVDASLWIAKADVPALLKGFSLHGVRRAGDEALLTAMASLLGPGASPLGVRLGGGHGR